MQSPSRQHQFTQVSSSITNLAFEVYRTLSPPGNFVFSPLGIYCVLGILYEGARGTTRCILPELLSHGAHFPLTPLLKALLDELHTRTQLTPQQLQSMKRAEAERKAFTDRGEWRKEFAVLYGEETAEDVRLDLVLANGMWIQDTYPYRPDFLEIMQSGLAAEIDHLDFNGKPVHASRIINSWVHHKTRGRIPAVLSPTDLPP